MNLDEFIDSLLGEIKERLGEGYECKRASTLKNNGVLRQGISICGPGENAAPTIYLEPYYDSYVSGTDMEEIAERLIAVFDGNRLEENPDLQFFLEYEKAKEFLSIRIINRERNAELLSEGPWVPFLDLAIVFVCKVNLPVMGEGTLRIRTAHLENWGIGTETLYKDAMDNFIKNDSFQCVPMIHYMLEMVQKRRDLESDGSNKEDYPETEFLGITKDQVQNLEEDMLPMYILTNESSFFGAAVISCREYLRELAEKWKSSFFLLPSSVHELIAIPEGENIPDIYSLKEMVCQVNREILSADEFLADSVYFYDFHTSGLSVMA